MTTPSPIARRDFLRLTGIAAGSLAVAPAFAAAEGTSEVPRSRTDRLATGANVCQWFRFPRNNSAEHFNNYISAAEADYMAHIGLKHVRLCVAPKVIMNPTSGDTRPRLERRAQGTIVDRPLLPSGRRPSKQTESSTTWKEESITPCTERLDQIIEADTGELI